MAPPLVAIVCLVGRSWHPTDDLAVIDLRARDVWSIHTPLTGLYSRPGWNHPGPLMFWMIAAISGIAGQAPWAVRVSGPIIQAGALAWLIVVTSRRGLRMLLAAGAVASLTYLGITANVFRLPWNLYLPIPFLLLFVFLVCIVATGGFRQLIAMSVAASIIVQAHIGYLPLIVAGFAWALGWVIRDWRKHGVEPERWRSTVLIASAFAVVTWIPPVIGAIVQTPGNLGLVVHYFTLGSHPSVGLHPAVGIMAAEFRFVPPWLGGGERLQFITAYALPSPAWWLLVPVVLLALGGFAAYRTKSQEDQRALGFAALLLVVGIIAISNADEPRAYTFQWRVIGAAFVVVTSIWAIASAIAPRFPHWVRVGVTALLMGVIILGGAVRAVSETQPGAKIGLDVRDEALAQLMDQLRQGGLPKQGQVLVRPYGTTLHHLFDGVVDALDRDGVDIRVDSGLARVFGSQRVGSDAKADAVWYVSEEGLVRRDLLRLPGARIIAETTPISLDDANELSRLQARLADELGAAKRRNLRYAIDSPLIALLTEHVPGVEQAVAQRVAQLNARVEHDDGCQCSVIAVSGPGRLQSPPRIAQTED